MHHNDWVANLKGNHYLLMNVKKGSEMSYFIVSYDLQSSGQDPHEEFITQAEALGWAPWIYASAKEKWYKLPNTVLIGDFASHDVALSAFKSTIAATTNSMGRAVKVEKFFLAAYSRPSFKSDVISDS